MSRAKRNLKRSSPTNMERKEVTGVLSGQYPVYEHLPLESHTAIPGLGRLRFLMHGLTKNLHQSLCNLWPDGDAPVEMTPESVQLIRQIFHQTLRVAKELIHAEKEGEQQHQLKDSWRLALSFVQSYTLRLAYVPKDDKAVDAEVDQIAVLCLNSLLGMTSTGEPAFECLLRGLPLLSLSARSLREHELLFVVRYTKVIAGLGAAIVNRRKVFGLCINRALGSYLSLPMDLSTDPRGLWRSSFEELLAGTLFEEKHIDEICKGPLPDASIGVRSVLPSRDPPSLKKLRSENEIEPTKPSTVYTNELYVAISTAVFKHPGTIAAGTGHLLKLFVRLTLGSATDGRGDSQIALRRRAFIRVLHFSLTLIDTLGGDSSEENSDLPQLGARLQCRASVLKVLSEELTTSAIPDHPSLARYNGLLTSLYEALLRDLHAVGANEPVEESRNDKAARKRKNTSLSTDGRRDCLKSSFNFVDILLTSLKFVVSVDHRPVVAVSYIPPPISALLPSGETSIAEDDRLSVLYRMLRFLRTHSSAALGSGGRELLVALITLHQDLRMFDNLIHAIMSVSGTGLDDGVTELLRHPAVQELLVSLFRGLPDAQLRGCWHALIGSYFEAKQTGTSYLILRTLELVSIPLSQAYASGSGRSLEHIPLDLLLPVLKEMDLLRVGFFRSAKGSDSVRIGAAISVLVVTRTASSLSALLAPHSRALTSGATGTQHDNSQNFRMWVELAEVAEKLLSAITLELVNYASNELMLTEILTTGISIFTLLVTLDGVRSHELGADADFVTREDCDEHLLKLLVGIVDVVEANVIPVSMCSLILSNLPVWAHLLPSGRAEVSSEGIQRLITQCMTRVVSTLAHGNDATIGRSFVGLISSAEFLEQPYLIDALWASLLAYRNEQRSLSVQCRVLLCLPALVFVNFMLRASPKSELQLSGKFPHGHCYLEQLYVSLESLAKQTSIDAIDRAAINDISGVLLSFHSSSSGVRTDGCSYVNANMVLELAAALFEFTFFEGRVAPVVSELLARLLSLSFMTSALAENSSNLNRLAVLVYDTNRVSSVMNRTVKGKLEKNAANISIHSYFAIVNGFNKSVIDALGRPFDNSVAVKVLMRHVRPFVEACLHAVTSHRDVTGLVGALHAVSLHQFLYNLAPVELPCDEEALASVTDMLDGLVNDPIPCRDPQDCRQLIQAIGISQLVLTVSGRSSSSASSVLVAVLRAIVSCDQLCELAVGTADYTPGFASVVSQFRTTAHSTLLTVTCLSQLMSLLSITFQFFSDLYLTEHTNGSICCISDAIAAACVSTFAEVVVSSLLENPQRFKSPSSVWDETDVTIMSVMAFPASLLEDAACRYLNPLWLGQAADRKAGLCQFAFVSYVASFNEIMSALIKLKQKQKTEKRLIIASRSDRRLDDATAESKSNNIRDKDPEKLLMEKTQDIIDFWAASATKVASSALSRISGVSRRCPLQQCSNVYMLVEKLLRLVEIAVSSQSDAHLNTSPAVLSAILRSAVGALCGFAKLETEVVSDSVTDSARRLVLSSAIRQCSRFLAGLANSRAIQKFAHLFSAVTVDTLSLYPSTRTIGILPRAGTTDLNGSHSGTIDTSPIIAGLFCLFDRCRSAKQRQQMFASLGAAGRNNTTTSTSRVLMAELHETYLREYKFVGVA